jgi:hypothetical protein
LANPESLDEQAMPKQPSDDGEWEPGTRRRAVGLALLFLIGGFVISFLIGFTIRNPNWPAQLPSLFSAHSDHPKDMTPVASPKTGEAYLTLLNADLQSLPAEQRTIAAILLNETEAMQQAETPLDTGGAQLPKFLAEWKATLVNNPADVKVEGEKVKAATDKVRTYFQDLESKLTAKLQKAGLEENLARDTAVAFEHRANSGDVLQSADAMERIGTELVALGDLATANTGKWQVTTTGFTSTDADLAQKLETHRQALDQAISDLDKNRKPNPE